jgi:hypothetical protein
VERPPYSAESRATHIPAMRCCTQPKRTMPTPSNPALPPSPPAAAPAPRKMPRLNRAGWIIKSLASIFVVAFLCAYARTTLRYGHPRLQTTASVSRPAPPAVFVPTHSRASHSRQNVFRRVHQVRRHARRSSPFYLASLRHLRRLFSQLLVVRT